MFSFIGWWLQFIPWTLSQEMLGFTPSSPSPVLLGHEMPSRSCSWSVPREPPSPRLREGSEALLQINIHSSPVPFFKGEALPCCPRPCLPSAHSSPQARVWHRNGVPTTEAVALPAAVLGHIVMEPSDPHRGRGHVIRSFLRRRGRELCSTHVSKARGKGGPNGSGEWQEEGGDGLGRQMVDGKGGRHWDKPARTSASPRAGSTGYQREETTSGVAWRSRVWICERARRVNTGLTREPGPCSIHSSGL